MKTEIHRLGIIGTGRIARRFVPEARTVEGVDVTAVYNPRISSAQKFAEELNVDFYTDDINVFLEKVDGVYIAAPHETHVDYSRKMMEAGKHVLSEIPAVHSMEDIKNLKAAVKAHPEVKYFCDKFLSSFKKTLDELD